MKRLIYIFLLLLAGCTLNEQKFGASDITADKVLEKYNASVEIKEKYVLEGTVLKREVKSDWRDRIEVKIGNTKIGADTMEFSPDLTISRWDEVSFTLHPKSIDTVATKDKTLSFDKEQIILSTPKVDYKMYELPIDEANPEGAFEYEIVLKEKPDMNVVEFQIDTQGLEFYYQPPLTQLEIDKGVIREERVIGSYAVYHKEKGIINNISGNDYKVGKAFHIYRPQIFDSEGVDTWGELNITEGRLTVAIPQEFLDKAVYPVRHAAGLSLGITSKGASSDVFYDSEMYGTKGTGAAGTVLNISTWLTPSNLSNDGVKTLLVNSTTLEILGNSVSIAETFGRYATSSSQLFFTFATNPTLTATDYFVSFIANASLYFYYDTVDIGLYDVSNSYASPANPVDNDMTLKRRYSLYATYCANATSETCVEYVTKSKAWFAPTNVTAVKVELTGGGGGGGVITGNGGGGGGGGAYARTDAVTVTAGNSYWIKIGAGGAQDTDGGLGTTTFATTTVIAASGRGTANNVKGLGGTTANSVGDSQKYAGGDGGDGYTTGDCGGGGGGAGGSTGAGKAGETLSGVCAIGGRGGDGSNGDGGLGGFGVGLANGTAGAWSVNGGGGGAGGANGTAGADGGGYGGGGGGGEVAGSNRGIGAGGLAILTYTIGSGEPPPAATYCGHTRGDWNVNTTCVISSSTTTPGTVYIGAGGNLQCIDGATISAKARKVGNGGKFSIQHDGCKWQLHNFQ